tara:strand:- start:181 stop:354 length:174 start_codon:yes stop_codon:yes gene_type:complete
MARPMKCTRCGRVMVSTARKNTRSCGKGKSRGVPAQCSGRMREIPWEDYDNIMEEEE